MRKWFYIMHAFLLLWCGAAVHAQADTDAQLYIVNSLSHDISVIDTSSNTLTSTIPLAANGYRITFSPDGTKAYITAAPGTLAVQDGQPTPQLVVVDTRERKVLTRIEPLDISPLANVHVTPDGKEALVVSAGKPGKRNSERGQVFFVNLEDGTVAQSVQVGLNPLASAMTPDGAKLFTADWASRSISVVDIPGRQLQDTIPLGSNTARTLVLDDNGTKLYTALEPAPTLQEFTRANIAKAQSLPVVAIDATAPGAAGAAGAAEPMGAPLDEGMLWEIDTATGAIAKYPLDGLNPVYALAVSPDGSTVYAYGRAPLSTQYTKQATEEGYDLIAVDLAKKAISRHYGNYGYLSDMLMSSDGSTLYLIGTPGDPEREKLMRSNISNHMDTQNGNYTQQQYLPTQKLLFEEVSQVKKTVTVLDIKTGDCIKKIPVGSLPQGAAMRSDTNE